MSDAPPRTARWVQSEDDIAELVALILDPARTQLVVGVTTQKSQERPLLDPDALAARLAERASVWVVVDPAHAWALTESLPPKIDVYGGAVRAWTPIAEGSQPYPSDHPQWTVFGPDDVERTIAHVVEFAALADNPPPPFGDVATATVTKVTKAGAELRLESGHPAFASTAHLIQHGEVFHAGDVLVPGQTVQVRIGAWHPQAARVSVSLRDFAPDPWQRIGEVYEPGQFVEAGVKSIAPFGAFVELLPGVEGLLHKSKIADAFVEYVEDYVQPGDRITVRLLSLNPDDHKAEVSLLDVPVGATPEPPASIYPGGAPWLPDAEVLAVRSAPPQDMVEQAVKAAVDAFGARLAELGAGTGEVGELSAKLRVVAQGLVEDERGAAQRPAAEDELSRGGEEQSPEQE